MRSTLLPRQRVSSIGKCICKETKATDPLSCKIEDFERPDQILKSKAWDLFVGDCSQPMGQTPAAWEKEPPDYDR